MSVSAAQAAVFYEEIVEHGQAWTIRDSGGVPAPLNGDGQRSMPFWSLRSRAEKVISNVPTYSAFGPTAIPLEEWRTPGSMASSATGSSWASIGAAPGYFPH
ncbi:hypothetical protein SCMU_00300 [Sinomonas cyclohexanicum]|uniref:DUF2750 domain-containing protein n=1 Tax=Sinomonas cyclohexanicum TaxID=322009 RepID=A0ABM7PPP6_SINCY|nr:DUF2750 domain-containing protein [Corynebacterium cyclohexanicum]BCT74188.1 hypothetical protein SCMU_00300 [Corynebacterium cyclohexanicum]